MLDSGASANVISLKVMNELGLKITRPYRNVCGIDFKAINVCGVIKIFKVCLAIYPKVSLSMDVIVIDVPDAWGMLLFRKWDATLGGSLHMELFYATIQIGDGSYVTLYNHPVTRNHVEYPRDRDDWSKNGFERREICDEPYETCEELIDSHLDPNPFQDSDILPFAQEYSIDDVDDMVLPKREYYRD
jgi:hypothetical protein